MFRTLPRDLILPDHILAFMGPRPRLARLGLLGPCSVLGVAWFSGHAAAWRATIVSAPRRDAGIRCPSRPADLPGQIRRTRSAWGTTVARGGGCQPTFHLVAQGYMRHAACSVPFGPSTRPWAIHWRVPGVCSSRCPAPAPLGAGKFNAGWTVLTALYWVVLATAPRSWLPPRVLP